MNLIPRNSLIDSLQNLKLEERAPYRPNGTSITQRNKFRSHCDYCFNHLSHLCKLCYSIQRFSPSYRNLCAFQSAFKRLAINLQLAILVGSRCFSPRYALQVLRDACDTYDNLLRHRELGRMAILSKFLTVTRAVEIHSMSKVAPLTKRDWLLNVK